MTRDTLAFAAFIASALCLCALMVAMLADIAGLAGIRLPRDAWTCTDQGPNGFAHHGVPDRKIAEEACRQWSRKP